MTVSEICEYKILGCALSDLSPDAYPFAVVIVSHGGKPFRVQSYTLRNWSDLSKRLPNDVKELIRSLIDDLRAPAPGDESKRLFDHLGGLGVGAVRSLQSGDCPCTDLETTLIGIFRTGSHPITWPESFQLNRNFNLDVIFDDVW